VKFSDAKKLHTGDEVIDKATGEGIYVLTTTIAQGKNVRFTLYGVSLVQFVMIEGIGNRTGAFRQWKHTEVK